MVTVSLFRQMKIQKGVDRQPSLMSHLLFFHQSTENISTIHTANEYCTLTKCFHNVRVLPGQNVCCFWVSKRIYKSCLQEFVAFPMTLSNSVLLWALNNNRTGHSKRNSIRCMYMQKWIKKFLIENFFVLKVRHNSQQNTALNTPS